jgi:hypothetical protein
MKGLKAWVGLLLATCAFCATTASATAAPVSSPAWAVQSIAAPTNFLPGDESGLDRYQVEITNSGGATTNRDPITIVDTLPVGLAVDHIELRVPRNNGINIAPAGCKTKTSGEVSTVSCEVTEALDALQPGIEPARLDPGNQLVLTIIVKTAATVSGTLVNQIEVKGGGAQPVSQEAENQASAADAQAGYQEFHARLLGADGRPATGAGSRPYQYVTSFALNMVSTEPGSPTDFVPAEGDLKEIEVKLPPGLSGNPTAIERCTQQQFATVRADHSPHGLNDFPNECPVGSALGLASIQQLEGGAFNYVVPLYNLIPPKGMPAQLGFEVAGQPVYINTRVRSDSDYGTTGFLHEVTEAKRVTASRITIWGVPWDKSHDSLRSQCAQLEGNCPVDGQPRPFWRLPTSCEAPMTSTMDFETWARPPAFAQTSETEPAPVECDKPPFDPTIEAKPTTNVADAPSGLHFDLHIPQAENEDPEGLGEADLKDTRVVLPQGMRINPASADGQGACSLAEIGYQGMSEGAPSFTADPPDCPEASKVGAVEIDAPAVDHPLPGAVYLARQGENPFNSLLAIYITANDPQTGVVVKLAGEVKLDPNTGQITTIVSHSPQVPFEDFKLDFFEGARAPLRTPSTCGTYQTTTSMTPWSSPAFGADAVPTDSFETTTAPNNGGTCPTSAAQLPNSPFFEAGSTSPIAGAYSPFVLRLSRQDDSQELKGLDLTLPAGMAAKFAGVAECSDGAIATAEGKSGRQEQASPSCPSTSHLGTVTVGAGAGPSPYHAKGDAYLAGPYQGAPLSMAVITPAVAGPFDLGTVVVRAPLFVDPETAQGTVKSTFPTILQGIPLDIRSISVQIDRADFTLNPTSCEAKEVKATAISVQGQAVPLSNRFQVGGCQNLGFKPSLSLKLAGGTKRGSHPSLKATLTYPKAGKYANIAFAQVALPHSEFLDQAHIGTVCTRVQFSAHVCPAKSVYGYARAVTPLFDKPLQGPVYLRSSSHQLPDLVADLNGQVEVALDGRNDSIHGGLRNTFEAVPDAPVSKFTLTLKGGRKGLLQNSTDVCVGEHKANARFVAHNGKVVVLRPELVAKCGGKKGKKQKGRSGSHKH